MIQVIRRWGIFWFLIFSYISAFGLYYLSSSTIIKRIELSAIHRFSGELLILLFFVFIYQSISDFFSNAEKSKNSNVFKELSATKRTYWHYSIDFLFYGSLLIVCFSGLGVYFVRFLQISFLKSYHYPFQFGHVVFGWFLLPIGILKYYRFTLRWIAELRHYLREY